MGQVKAIDQAALAAENKQLREELRFHQQILTVLCIRDGRIRCDAEEFKALEDHQHHLHFRHDEDGATVIDYEGAPFPRLAD